ncbi:hypothetical protein VAA_03417 [Vibrio anguillarum 775]|nr:hypothetical protein VAA_03417 [Vibrio anguillarum 775]
MYQMKKERVGTRSFLLSTMTGFAIRVRVMV